MSPADAGVDNLKATAGQSRQSASTLVGEDTDLLILLLHYCKKDNKTIYFRFDVNK
ncbi:hypothetical protein DPMN_041281 [Dreissena polymorpha]|uniref:Uncharacterized protein n=1 Tax=Dreissena polymorpha TaxID=45954 RepID=A0A9D4HXQ9_DREPO|nr:hypothetical protein DPMN_041281 [Dreissena polymorpha]